MSRLFRQVRIQMFKSEMFICKATVFSGTGNVEINGRDINYFELTQPKEMVSLLKIFFPFRRLIHLN